MLGARACLPVHSLEEREEEEGESSQGRTMKLDKQTERPPFCFNPLWCFKQFNAPQMSHNERALFILVNEERLAGL